jgi:hypothetical protein
MAQSLCSVFQLYHLIMLQSPHPVQDAMENWTGMNRGSKDIDVRRRCSWLASQFHVLLVTCR